MKYSRQELYIELVKANIDSNYNTETYDYLLNQFAKQYGSMTWDELQGLYACKEIVASIYSGKELDTAK